MGFVFFFFFSFSLSFCYACTLNLVFGRLSTLLCDDFSYVLVIRMGSYLIPVFHFFCMHIAAVGLLWTGYHGG